MLDKIFPRFWVLSAAWRVARHYMKHPYSFHTPTTCDELDHEHICFVTRLPYIDLEAVCPCKDYKDLEPGIDDCCDNCPYLGTVNYRRDMQTGKIKIFFTLSDKLAKIYKD